MVPEPEIGYSEFGNSLLSLLFFFNSSILFCDYDFSNSSFLIWRRKWQPTPVFLPGEFHGQRSLEGYSPRSCRVRRDTCQLPCCTCCNWPQVKNHENENQFIQCSSPIQFLQVADFGFISTFYSCFMREKYSGRILLYSYLRWISIGFFSPELIIKMFLLCIKQKFCFPITSAM